MKKMTIAVMLAATMVAVAALWCFKPICVELELVACIQNPSIDVNDGVTDFHSEVHWWFVDALPNADYIPGLGDIDPAIGGKLHPYFENIQQWGVGFDEIDFSINNVVLSFSRGIAKMEVKKKQQFLFNKQSTVSTKMSKIYEPNTIYVYKMPKFKICMDAKAYTDATIEH